jgi:hypothetical protein
MREDLGVTSRLDTRICTTTTTSHDPVLRTGSWKHRGKRRRDVIGIIDCYYIYLAEPFYICSTSTSITSYPEIYPREDELRSRAPPTRPVVFWK